MRLKIVLKLFLLLLVIYFSLRISFGVIYFGNEEFNFINSLQIIYWGLRMDYAALVYINVPFLLFFFLVNPVLSIVWQLRFSSIIFLLVNLPFIALNVIDLVYFRYNLRRSTVDVLYSLPASIHSFGFLFSIYWFVLLGFIGFSILLVFLSNKIIHNLRMVVPVKKYVQWLPPVLFFVFSLLLARGWGNRPIVPATPLLYFDPAIQPLVNNSTLNFIYSYTRYKSNVERKKYFSETQLDSIFSIRRQYDHQTGFQKRNVVVFLMESFAESYFREGPLKAHTPFFDSLRNKSMVCSAAFQNGHESVKGILAGIGSIPPFLDEPMFMSNYNSVPFKGLGSILREEGYTSNFFLGAEYDHFNFAKLCKMVGIDHYYSKDTYDQSDKDDGNWGIYDEYFFSYFADVTSQIKQPFFSVLFNISSHPPFKLPPHRKPEFKIAGQSSQLNAISYVDNCFSQLFQKIKDEPWFANTIFVFFSDHTLLAKNNERSFLYKSLQIPLFIYDSQKPLYREISKPVQQLDIVPTIMDMLHYSKPFMSFGNSFLRDQQGFSVSNMFGAYQLIDSSTITGYDDNSDRILYHYDRLRDKRLETDLSANKDVDVSKQSTMIKAILQRFNNSLLDRNLLIE